MTDKNGKTTNPETTAMQKAPAPFSARFTEMVVTEFSSSIGTVNLSSYQKRLAQHLFVALDTQLKALEAKRLERSDASKGLPIVWSNVNMEKLAVDAVHRIELGLDALVPNHIHPVPYFNKRRNQYDLDLRIGYVGKDFYRRSMAVDPPMDVIYELVHETDVFVPLKRSIDNQGDSYRFEIPEPFSRGEIVGGFGYIVYDDPRKNKLIIVSAADFEKARKKAQSDTFWRDYPTEMRFKTLVSRVTSKLSIDPAKVSQSFLHTELDDVEAQNQREIDELANKTIIDVDAGPSTPVTSDPPSGPADDGWLNCPPEIDEARSRRHVVDCHVCSNRVQCNPYAEWSMEQTEEKGPGF